MKSELKSKSKKVIVKKVSNDADEIENGKKSQNESNVSVFTRSTNPKVVVGSEKVDEKVSHCKKQCSWRVIKFVFMVVMSILLIITFFVSLRTYHMVENLSIDSISSLN